MVRPREFDPQIAIDRALSVFRKQGYKGSSLQDLIRAMGISKSSFYETFGSKYELFLTTLTRFHHTDAIYQTTITNVDIPAKTMITDMFNQLIDSVINGEGGCLFGNSAVEFSSTDTEVTAQITNGIKRLEQLFYQILMRKHINGEIWAKHNIQTTARQLTTTFYGLQIMANANIDRKVLDEIVSNAVAILDQKKFPHKRPIGP